MKTQLAVNIPYWILCYLNGFFIGNHVHNQGGPLWEALVMLALGWGALTSARHIVLGMLDRNARKSQPVQKMDKLEELKAQYPDLFVSYSGNVWTSEKGFMDAGFQDVHPYQTEWFLGHGIDDAHKRMKGE
jgi:hypothetical protein